MPRLIAPLQTQGPNYLSSINIAHNQSLKSRAFSGTSFWIVGLCSKGNIMADNENLRRTARLKRLEMQAKPASNCADLSVLR